MSRMAEQQLYIHGGYTSATSGRTFETINPANGNVLATVQAAGREDVDRAVKSAQQGQKIWASMTACWKLAAISGIFHSLPACCSFCR